MKTIYTFGSIKRIHVFKTKKLSQVIQTLMYIVKCEFVFPQYVNTSRTHYAVSELENRWSLLRISIHFIYEGMQRCLLARGWVSCCISYWLVLFTPLWWLVVKKYHKKKNCSFLIVPWQSIRSQEWSSADVSWYHFIFPWICFRLNAKFLTIAVRLMQLILYMNIALQNLYFEMHVGQSTAVMGPKM